MNKTNQTHQVGCTNCSNMTDTKLLETDEQLSQKILAKGVSLLRAGKHAEARKVLDTELLTQVKILHKFHQNRFNAYLALSGCCRVLEDVKTEYKYVSLTVEALKACRFTNHPELGSAYFDMGETLLAMAAAADGPSDKQKDDKVKYLKRAIEVYKLSMEIRKVCLGKHHPTTRFVLARLKSLSVAPRKKSKKKKAKRRRK